MSNQSFVTDLWYRDMLALSTVQQEIATSLLIYATLELACRPYHRASKADAPSDRQTILKHPLTGYACLVFSVVPSTAEPNSYVLRLDFFDRAEKVSVPFAKVHRAPKTQWKEKGERRFVVPADASVADLRRVIQEIVAVDR